METTTLSREKFIRLYTLDEDYRDKIDQIEQTYGVPRQDLWKWYALPESKKEIKHINRIKAKYQSVLNHNPEEMGFKSLIAMYEWYLEQPRVCAYCGTAETVLQHLFGNGFLKTKRSRGPSLEIDRKQCEPNVYSADNCVLACYLCNNAKSDLIEAEEFKQYIAPGIGKFLSNKYQNSLSESSVIA